MREGTPVHGLDTNRPNIARVYSLNFPELSGLWCY